VNKKPRKHKRAALVTGAAAGLGACLTELLADDGFDIILVDRHAEAARARAAELSKRYRVRTHVIEQDLSQPVAASNVQTQCDALGWEVEVLVNNAGSLLNKYIHQLPWQQVECNLHLMLKVVVELCHRFLPGMIQRGSGHLLNVASVSGFLPGGALLAVYNSAKAFLIPFTETLNFELEGTGVQATAVCPGFMRTDIFAATGLEAVRDSVPKWMWTDPRRVAEEAYRAAKRGQPVYVSGITNRLILTMARFVPRAVLRERTRILHGRGVLDLLTRARPTMKPPGRHAALITGASAGIGKSFSEVLASEGFDVILVARRGEILRARAEELSRTYGVQAHPIAQDLTDPRAVEIIRAECERLGWPVDVLVNNAGFPVTELFHRMKWTEVDGIFRLYVQSVVHLTHSFVPGMIERGWGRVINVASMAGFEPGSYRSSLYSSSKAFLISFSESIAKELEGTGVSATALCPGFTKTEWFSKNKLKNDYVPNILWVDSDHVARAGLKEALRGAPVSIVGTPAHRVLLTMFQMAPRHALGQFLSKKRKNLMGA